MTPTIRIDDDVWQWLKTHARPLEDTPNSVLRRIAGLDKGQGPTSLATPVATTARVRRPGRQTPQGAYREPILQILARHGGQASRTQVLAELEEVLADQFTDFDKGEITSGSIRWQKSAEWQVSTMRQEGLLKAQTESPRGVWWLSAEGTRRTRALSPQ